jgi:hypothetical protein
MLKISAKKNNKNLGGRQNSTIPLLEFPFDLVDGCRFVDQLKNANDLVDVCLKFEEIFIQQSII